MAEFHRNVPDLIPKVGGKEKAESPNLWWKGMDLLPYIEVSRGYPLIPSPYYDYESLIYIMGIWKG